MCYPVYDFLQKTPNTSLGRLYRTNLGRTFCRFSFSLRVLLYSDSGFFGFANTEDRLMIFDGTRVNSALRMKTYNFLALLKELFISNRPA
jgi:hypothetical protein